MDLRCSTRGQNRLRVCTLKTKNVSFKTANNATLKSRKLAEKNGKLSIKKRVCFFSSVSLRKCASQIISDQIDKLYLL